MRKRVLLALVAGVVSSMTVGGIALAGGAANSTITLKMRTTLSDDISYSGKVKSSKDRCVKGRKVEISHEGEVIARAVTDENGNWEVVGPIVSEGDQVTAKVKPKRNSRGKTVCKGASAKKQFGD